MLKHVALFVLTILAIPYVFTCASAQDAVRALPPKDSPIRETAAKYNFSMNMLLFPDYFMSDEQFQELAKKGFADNNIPTVVSGLQAYGYKVSLPKSAEDYRTKVYPLILDHLKKTGYVAVEIPVNGANPDMCPRLKKEIEKLGLGVTAVGQSGDDLQASLKHCIDCSHALGAKVFAGPLVLRFKSYPKEIGNARVDWVYKRLKELEEPIRKVAEYAKSKNVKLAVEPLNRFELPGLNRLGQAIFFVKRVNHPNFGVMIDTCHEMSDGDGPKAFAYQVKTLMKMNRLFHCHISAIHRGRVDKGWFTWHGIFGPIIKTGYKGNMSMEIFDATLPFSEVVHINRKQFANPLDVTVGALIASANNLNRVEKSISKK